MMQDISNPYTSNQSSKSNVAPSSSATPSSLFGWLRHCDIYTKVDEEYRVQTETGAFLSLVGWVIIAILVMSEVNSYLASNSVPKEHMVVDTKLGQQLEININMTYHALTCAEVHMDAMDVAGDNQLNVEHDFLKQRVSAEGHLVGEPGIEIIGDRDTNVTKKPEDYCGDCFGASNDVIKCCNNCDELIAAYNFKGWSTNIIIRTAEQCLHDTNNPFANVRPGEGCRLTGTMKVNKVAGNVHMTIGESIVRDGAHIHQFVPSEAPNFNVSHTIHSLSFGKRHDFLPTTSFLDGAVRYVSASTTGGTGLFQYFIRIVPTEYVDKSGATSLVTNQFTYTEKFRPVNLDDYKRGPFQSGPSPVIPGIFFVYELSPFLVQVSTAQVPLSHLVTRLLAIVGGVFCIIGILDSLWYKLFRGK